MADFDKIEMRVGRIVLVEDFPAAPNPSYRLTVDFGPFGTRRSSAAVRLVHEGPAARTARRLHHEPPAAPDRDVRFGSADVGGAIDTEERVTLLEPDADCELGSRIG